MKNILMCLLLLSFNAKGQHNRNNVISMKIDNVFNGEYSSSGNPLKRYDIIQRKYEDFRVNSPKVYRTNISLTEKEVSSIIQKYYELQLHKLSTHANLKIDEYHQSYPWFATNIIVKQKWRTQLIEYEGGCEKYMKGTEKENANRVKNFIDFTFKIINSKPEIKNAPKQKIGFQ